LQESARREQRERRGSNASGEKRKSGGEGERGRIERAGPEGRVALVVAATEADNVAATGALERGLRGDDVDGEVVKAELLEQVLGLGVDVDGDALGVERRDFGDKVVLALALLLLELERDAADRTALDALHQVRREAGNLVAQALGRDDGNLVADLLVDVEVKGQTRVVLLDDDARSALDGLGTDAAHG